MSGHRDDVDRGQFSTAELTELKARVPIASLIGDSIQLKRNGRNLIGLCLFHSEKSPSFYVYQDHFHCFGCGAHGDAFDWLMKANRMSFLEAVRHIAGGAAGPVAQPARQAPPERSDREAGTKDLARRIWSEGIVPAGTIVERYLASRNLHLPETAALRFHPACPRADERLPAILALMTDPVSAAPVGVHRTFLQPDGSGKAVGKAKMMLGNTGIVRLVDDCEVTQGLGLAEGIETALAVMQGAGWRPVWAAGFADGMRTFPVLPGIEELTLFADRDDKGTGVNAARECAARWAAASVSATIHLPPPGTDWADVVASLRAA